MTTHLAMTGHIVVFVTKQNKTKKSPNTITKRIFWMQYSGNTNNKKRRERKKILCPFYSTKKKIHRVFK